MTRVPTRKDSKGRILRRGEGQRPNGQYYFKFKDAKGKTKYKYSWTLTTHDLPPKGKNRDCASAKSRSRCNAICLTALHQAG